MELKCTKCSIPISNTDIFCSNCGIRIRTDIDGQAGEDLFYSDALALLKMFNEFRSWIDQRKNTNIRFMKAYKRRLVDEIGPSIRQFREKYGDTEGGRSQQFELILETFASFERPTTLMETKLRPSVSIGVWQERWMMTKAVEDYLTACCQEADRHINELKRTLTSP